jgi:structural maintenance of chromosome 1
MYHIEKQLESISNKILAVKKDSKGFTSQQEDLQVQLKEAKQLYARATKQVLIGEKRLQEKEKEALVLKPELLELEEQLKHTEEKFAKAEENFQDTQSAVEQQKKNIKQLEMDLANVNKSIALHEETASTSAQLKLSKKQLETYGKLRESVDARTFSEKTRLKAINRQLKAAQETLLRYEGDLAKETDNLKTLEDQKANLELNRVRLEAAVTTAKTQLASSQNQLREIDSERKRLNQLDIELNEKLTQVVNRLLQAKVDQQENDRTKKFRETLENLKRLYSGVHGKLLDLCKPSQKKFGLAVSVIMGKNMDAIVVDCEKTAIDCIAYMRDQRAGQATFLPLDSISVKPVNEKYRSIIQGARLALDVLQFEPLFERVVKYAVGNALISDNTEIAKQIVYEKGQEVKVVAMDGTVFHKTGMITGGQADTDNSKKWQQKEVEDLQARREQLLQELADISKKKRKVGHDDLLVSEIVGNENRVTRLEEELLVTCQKIESVEKEIEFSREKIESCQGEVEMARGAHDSIQEQANIVDEIIKTAENDIFAKFCDAIGVHDIREYESAALKETQSLAEKRLEYTTAQAKLQSMIAFDKQRAQDFETRLSKIEASRTAILAAQKKLIGRKASLLKTFEKIESEKAAISKTLDQSRADCNEKTVELAAVKKLITNLNSQNDMVSKQLSKCESEMEILRAEKIALVRKCKLEEIALPLTNDATLDEISLEEFEVYVIYIGTGCGWYGCRLKSS